jgi:4-alpha-glucanotransferase
LARLRGEEKEGLRFYEWLQWQCCEQFRKAKAHALGKGVLILGDLPLLVSRDSADVWARQNYFKLDRVSGAPPDLYIAEGQRWGMPPYNWEEIAAHGHEYTIQKVRYAQNFYDLFRIDHVVGLFRLWTIAVHEPLQNAGKYGVFDPQNEALWEEHGKKIIDVMVSNTDMLPCAEDLGVVPECSYKTLREYAMPGMDVQRWTRHWESQGEFKAPSEYRKNSLALMSTHDMSIFLGWWNHEVGTADEGLFDNMCRTHHMDPAAMKQKLFEPPVYGRLRWKKEISSPDALAYALERPHDHIRAFLDLHRLSFHEKEQFLGYLGCRETPPVREFVRKSLEKASESRAVFCIQLIHDWLSLGDYFDADPWHARINFPGTVNDGNWSFRSPVSLEALQALEGINKQILEINKKTVRI